MEKEILNGSSKLNNIAVLEIRAKFKPRIYTKEMLANEYGVTISAIQDVLRRKTWNHI